MIRKIGKGNGVGGYVLRVAIPMIVVIMLVCPTLLALAAEEVYESKSPPPNEAIIKTADTLQNCDHNIQTIIGKQQLHLSDDTWNVYYVFKAKGGQSTLNNDMRLKKLDTNIWVVECGDIMLRGITWGVIKIPK